MSRPLGVLFVCMGNICRSPTAQGVAEGLLSERGLAGQIAVDSAGTHGYHIGQPPDPRAIAAAARRGLDLRDQRARQVAATDFASFDYVVAMERQNLRLLEDRRPTVSPAWLGLLGDLDQTGAIEVPDPYYGADDGFESVLDLLTEAIGNLLPLLVSRHKLSQQRDSD